MTGVLEAFSDQRMIFADGWALVECWLPKARKGVRTSLTSSKSEKSIVWTVLNDLPEAVMKLVVGGLAACASG